MYNKLATKVNAIRKSSNNGLVSKTQYNQCWYETFQKQIEDNEDTNPLVKKTYLNEKSYRDWKRNTSC